MSITCIEKCADANHSKHYSNITAGKYIDERMIEIGSKINKLF